MPHSPRPRVREPAPDDGHAFLPDPRRTGHARARDLLAEVLAEEFLESVTFADGRAEAERGVTLIEEFGGPFVEVSGDEEFADGTDASNPIGATREPFPTANRAPRR